MNVIYNGIFLDDKASFLGPDNRAFQYGDGVFETIIFEDGEILFLKDHFQRLHQGLKAIKIDLPELLRTDSFISLINELLNKNNLLEKARIKLIIWRKPGGLFSPTERSAEFLITAKEHNPVIPSERKLDFCNAVSLSYSSVSAFKRISSLPYILAGLEMQERQLDDIILLDHEGHISECLYSNIFWIKDHRYYTPSLETGCIDGIRRKNLIKKIEESGNQVNIVKSTREELLDADHAFSTNVAGIYPITKIGDKEFKPYIPYF